MNLDAAIASARQRLLDAQGATGGWDSYTDMGPGLVAAWMIKERQQQCSHRSHDRLIADFEDGTLQGVDAHGGFGRRPVSGFTGDLPQPAGFGGEFWLSSAGAGGRIEQTADAKVGPMAVREGEVVMAKVAIFGKTKGLASRSSTPKRASSRRSRYPSRARCSRTSRGQPAPRRRCTCAFATRRRRARSCWMTCGCGDAECPAEMRSREV